MLILKGSRKGCARVLELMENQTEAPARVRKLRVIPYLGSRGRRRGNRLEERDEVRVLPSPADAQAERAPR
jgi:hypothetical protein